MILLPQKTNFIFENLNVNGFECFAVGGCVRDLLMGNEPQDFDFATDATPDEIIKCFEGYKFIDIGKKYGTVAVIEGNDCFEITTYRVDGEYTDSRHPEAVSFSKNIYDDLSRRDFTVNSIAYNEKAGIVDPFGGAEDIKNKIIRATGNADRRMDEDALRILRGLRFSSKLGFVIEESTLDAMYDHKASLALVHPFRIKNELEGLLLSNNVADVLSQHREIIKEIIPELSPMFDCVQNNPHHRYDVWTHTIKAVENTPSDLTLRLAALFHDIGKPFSITTDKNGINHFKGHQYISEEIASEVLSRFGFPKGLIKDVSGLIIYHDERFRNLNADIKRVLTDIDTELFSKLLILSKADTLAQSDYKRQEKLSHINDVENEFAKIIDTNQCYKISQLNISGDDLKRLGFEGKEIGDKLTELLFAVINGKVNNHNTDLIEFAAGGI